MTNEITPAVAAEAKEAVRFGILRTEGARAALSHNFGAEARAASKAKVAFKGVGVAVGLGAIGDAMFRSEKAGPDGQAEKRGVLGRWTEAVVGAGIVAGSALRGHR